MVSFLTPILGLYGINVKEFINDFEEKTKFINFDLIVPVRVKISKIKTFSIDVSTPYIIPVLHNVQGFSLNKPELINVLTLYKISLIKSIFRKHYSRSFNYRVYSSIKSYVLRVMKIGLGLQSNGNLGDLDITPYLNLKKSINKFFFSKKLVYGTFGAFFCFNNMNNAHLAYLSNSLFLLNLNILKVPARFLNILISRRFFSSNNIYISSTRFSWFYYFARQLINFSQRGNFFITYFRFNSNLISPLFFKSFVNSFNIVSSTSVVFLIYKIFLKLFKTFSYLNTICLKLLNYNANLSSNIKNS